VPQPSPWQTKRFQLSSELAETVRWPQSCSLFQSRGPATSNDLSPRRVLHRGMTHVMAANERRQRLAQIIERVVKSRLSDHLTSNNLINPHQSAYCKHHSTETALLYIHDHLINAICSRKISCLCLLDLSAAFDTINHNILLTRLSSWFGIHATALNWFRSYLSSRCFRVKCNSDFSSPHTCFCGVPKAQFSALCSLSCTQPHLVLLFHLSLNHHLYADDTQLFLSFHPEPRLTC